MKEKNQTCKYCLKTMDAKTTRQEFCSPKCRVYWNRENPQVKVTNLNKNTNQKSLEPQGGDKTPKTIDTTKKQESGELSSFERMRRKKMGL